MADSSQAGYHASYAAALLAFAQSAPVHVVIATDQCVSDQPKLIGLSILR
jgi:hypothetical protein